MGIRGRLLVVVWGVTAFVAVYLWYQVGIELGALGMAAVWAIPIGYFVALGVWINSAQLSITFGGAGRLGRNDIGDSPYNVDGAIFEYVFTISNVGGKKLTLEPKLILRDRKTDNKLCEVEMMADFPLPKQQAIRNGIGKPNWGIASYCPNLISLKPEDTMKYSIAFCLEKHFVDLIGVDENNTIKVFNAKENLEFIDRARGIVFECCGKHMRMARCIKSRFH